jgi:hypothetical protein
MAALSGHILFLCDSDAQSASTDIMAWSEYSSHPASPGERADIIPYPIKCANKEKPGSCAMGREPGFVFETAV